MNNPLPKKRKSAIIPFTYPITKTVKLEKSPKFKKVDLIETVLQRRTQRNFSKISLSQIGRILWISSKAYECEIDADKYILSHRPSPSAGAKHPIDILISSVSKGRHVLQYYNPFEHSLNELNITNTLIEKFIFHINDIVNVGSSTVVWFVAHPNRTTMKYKYATSLIWRDAGALIYCFQLACTALEVNSCPVGSLGEPFISQMFRLQGKTFGAGGLLIG